MWSHGRNKEEGHKVTNPWRPDGTGILVLPKPMENPQEMLIVLIVPTNFNAELIPHCALAKQTRRWYDLIFPHVTFYGLAWLDN
jgi:hypothetical protein